MHCRRAVYEWILLTASLINLSLAMCPPQCTCLNEILQATCHKGGLDYFPIQLNPGLHLLNLSSNRITIVNYLNVYSQLKNLDLTRNRIDRIPPFTFNYQKHLLYLNLSHNNIHSFNPDSFNGLDSLIELDLSYNNLRVLHTAAFQNFISLQLVKIANNQLESLEKGLFISSTLLLEVILDNNFLTELPGQAIGEASDLRILSIKQNYIECIKGGDIPALPKLQVLLLNANIIRDIEEAAFSKIPTLEVLDISENNLTAVPTSSLEKLQYLTKLNIGGNAIKFILSVALKGLFHLKNLNIDRCIHLSRIDPRAFVDNINLQVISMDNNIAIQNLPTRLFHGNPRLAQIFARNNHLSTLDAAQFPLDQLNELQLGGNPLECNCSLLWLWRLAQAQTNIIAGNYTNQTELILDVEYIRCEKPLHLSAQLLIDVVEYDMGCSWRLSIIMYSFLVFGLLLTAAALTLYFYPFKSLKKSDQLAKEVPSSACTSNEMHVFKGTDINVQSFVSNPDLTDNNYAVLERWDIFEKDDTVKRYRQFKRNTKEEPHIVYV